MLTLTTLRTPEAGELWSQGTSSTPQDANEDHKTPMKTTGRL